MLKTVDLIVVNQHGVQQVVAKISLSSAYEPKDKEIFTIELYETKLPAIYLKEKEDEKIVILNGINGLPPKKVMGNIEKVNNFSILKKLL